MNLGKGVDDFFESSEDEISNGSVQLLPQSFQDDLMRYCKDPLSAQYGLDRFEHLAESKVLQYNETKSFIIILGAKGARRRLKKEFQDNPPTLYGRPMQIVDNQSYLGDQIGFSNAESITLTLNKRLGIARKAVFDIKTVLEDSRSTVAGGIKTGILLWESCVIPFLLNNCSTWMEIRSRDVERLNKVQNLFLNCLLGVFKCPVDLMYWDLSF